MILIYFIILNRTIVKLNNELLNKLTAILDLNVDKSDLTLKKLNEISEILSNWNKDMANLIVEMKSSNKGVIQDLNSNLNSHIDKIDIDSKSNIGNLASTIKINLENINKSVSKLDTDLIEHIQKLSLLLDEKLEKNNQIISTGLVKIDNSLKETINL